MPKPSPAAPSDERRERFEKWSNKRFSEWARGSSDPQLRALWSIVREAYQQGTLDTREECGQTYFELVADGCTDVNEILERIRGKGAQP